MSIRGNPIGWPLHDHDGAYLPSSGGDLTGELRMNGQPISGLNPPTEDTQAANKGYVDSAVHLGAISVRGSSSSLTLAAGKITALTLDTIIAQDGVGEFSFSGGGVKVPLDGIVLVSGSVYINGSTTDTTMMEGAYVYKNDTEVAGVWMYQHATSSIATPMALVAVNAGDVIYLKARRYGAGDCIPSARGTHLDIMYV